MSIGLGKNNAYFFHKSVEKCVKVAECEIFHRQNSVNVFSRQQRGGQSDFRCCSSCFELYYLFVHQLWFGLLATG